MKSSGDGMGILKPSDKETGATEMYSRVFEMLVPLSERPKILYLPKAD